MDLPANNRNNQGNRSVRSESFLMVRLQIPSGPLVLYHNPGPLRGSNNMSVPLQLPLQAFPAPVRGPSLPAASPTNKPRLCRHRNSLVHTSSPRRGRMRNIYIAAYTRTQCSIEGCYCLYILDIHIYVHCEFGTGGSG